MLQVCDKYALFRVIKDRYSAQMIRLLGDLMKQITSKSQVP